MDFFASNTFGSFFYTISAILTLFVVAQGYYKNKFFRYTANIVAISLVVFTIFYLSYRFGIGHTTEKIEMETVHNKYYVWWAGLHGALSFTAIVYTCTVFVYASQSFNEGGNYFREHPKKSFLLIVLWPVAILSGILI